MSFNNLNYDEYNEVLQEDIFDLNKEMVNKYGRHRSSKNLHSLRERGKLL